MLIRNTITKYLILSIALLFPKPIYFFSKHIIADSPVIVNYSVRRVSSDDQSVDAILTCTSDSRPISSITWFSNDMELNNSTRHQIHHSILKQDTLMCCILIIYNISAEDEGNYTCFAVTRLGNDNATITFSYSGKYFTIRPRCMHVILFRRHIAWYIAVQSIIPYDK